MLFLKQLHCRYHPKDLVLRGDLSFGAEEQFANEANMAVRLSNFISAFLQVCTYISYITK